MRGAILGRLRTRFTPPLAAAGLLAAAFLAAPAGAQAFSDPGLGVGASGVFSKAGGAESGFFSLGLQIRLRVTGNLGVEALLTYRREEYTAGGEPVLRVDEVPLQGSILVFFLTRTPVQPVLLAGGGYYYVRSSGLNSNEVGRSTENKFGFHAGIGVDARIAKRASIAGGVRYVLLPVSQVQALSESYGVEANSNFVQASVGLFLYF